MTSPERSRRLTLRSATLALAVGAARGGNQVAIKFALTAMSPLWTAFARMALSSVTIAALSRRDGAVLRPGPGERGTLLTLGLLFSVQIGMLHWGADLTSPAYAVILINTNPIFANVIAHFFVPEDRLSLSRVLGLGIAFSGVCAVMFGRPHTELAPNPLLGNGLMVLSGALVGARTVYIQRVVQRMPTARAIFWQMVISLPCFAAGAWLAGDRVARGSINFPAVTAIVYQGLIVGGVAILIWVKLLKKHTPGAISVFSFVTPPAGLVLASIFFGEELTPRLFIGLAAVLGGIALVTGAGAARQDADTP